MLTYVACIYIYIYFFFFFFEISRLKSPVIKILLMFVSKKRPMKSSIDDSVAAGE